MEMVDYFWLDLVKGRSGSHPDSEAMERMLFGGVYVMLFE